MLFAGKLVPFLENAVAHASVLTILTISFERYFAICYPLKTLYICNTRRSVLIIAVVWIVALVSATPFAIISSTEQTGYHDSSMVTVCRSHVKDLWIQLYVIGTTVLFFALPFCLLVFVYSVIVFRISRESKQLRNNNSCSKGATYTIRTRRRTVLMVGVIMILFFVCLLPIRVFTVWVIYAPVSDVENLGFEVWLNLNMFVRVMFYLNSATNPIVYNIMSIKFRQAFLKTLGIKKTFPTSGHSTLVTRFSSQNSSYRRKSYRMSIV